jgi:hypothetical protein
LRCSTVYTAWGPAGAEGEELYDYQADPEESRNLATDAGFAATKLELRTRLEHIALPEASSEMARDIPGRADFLIALLGKLGTSHVTDLNTS